MRTPHGSGDFMALVKAATMHLTTHLPLNKRRVGGEDTLGRGNLKSQSHALGPISTFAVQRGGSFLQFSRYFQTYGLRK